MPLDDDLWALALERAAASPAPTNSLRDLLWRSLHLSGWQRQPPRDAHGPRASTDRALLERFVHGDADAFETLVERHGGALLALARRSLSDGCREYAEDAVQEAYLSLFSKAHDVIAAPDRNVLGFLFQATRIEVTRILRQDLHDEGPADGLLAALPSRDPELLEHLRACERRDLVTLLLDACTGLEQEVMLVVLQGRPATEVALALELEDDHVRVLEHRALGKLAAALAARAS